MQTDVQLQLGWPAMREKLETNRGLMSQLAGLLRGTGHKQMLARGVVGALLVQGGGALLILLSEIVLARLLGVTQFGIYATVTAWMFMLVLLGTLGFNHALLRYVPTYIASESWGLLRGILKRTARWTLVASLAIVAATLLVVWGGQHFMAAGIALAFTVALIGLPLQVLSGLRQATLRGLQQIARALLPEYIVRPLILLLLCLIVASASAGMDAVMALALNLLAIGVAFLIGALWQRRYLPNEATRYEPVYQDREWREVAWPLFMLVGLATVESSRTDIMLLGVLVNADAAGIYAASNRLAEIVLFVIASMNAAAAPMMARLHATGQRPELQSLVSMATLGVLAMALPLSCVLLLFGEPILQWFGAAFAAGYLPLVVLLASQLVVALAGSVMLLLTLTGYQTNAAKFMAWGVALKLLLAFILIPIFGMLGAAISTLCGALLWNMSMLVSVRRNMGVDPSIVGLFSHYWKSKPVEQSGTN